MSHSLILPADLLPFIDNPKDATRRLQLQSVLAVKDHLQEQLALLQQNGCTLEKEIRHLKVYSRSYVRQYSPLEHVPNTPVPEIRLMGLWLQKAGFYRGDAVRVVALPRLLIITPEELEGGKVLPMR